MTIAVHLGRKATKKKKKKNQPLLTLYMSIWVEKLYLMSLKKSLKCIVYDFSYIVVHRTEVIKKTLNPTWKPITISVRALCNGDYDR